jgi:hypothetical protein
MNSMKKLLLILLASSVIACSVPTVIIPKFDHTTSQTITLPTGLRSIHIELISINQKQDVPTITVEGYMPDSCADFAIITHKIYGDLIDIKLQATPTNGNCFLKDRGLPFQVDIPITTDECLEGTYRIGVNGVPNDLVWQAPASLCDGSKSSEDIHLPEDQNE